MGKLRPEVTDDDLKLLQKQGVEPHYKMDLLRNDEEVTLASRHIRVQLLQRLDGRPIPVIAPDDALKVPLELRRNLLKRDSANALEALSQVLRVFDSANSDIPDFESLPDHELYVRRLEAIMDVINEDPDLRRALEQHVEGGISRSWVKSLESCLAMNRFGAYDLHNINKLVGVFSRITPDIADRFETAYIKKSLEKTEAGS